MEPGVSDMAIGAVLFQQYNDRLYIMVVFSKKYTAVKWNYTPHNKELLAIFKACQK